MLELLHDTQTTSYDLIAFAGHAEDAVTRCNADKVTMRRLLNGGTP